MKLRMYRAIIMVLAMAGMVCLMSAQPVDAKKTKEKKIKTITISNKGKSLLINKKEKLQLKAKVKPKSLKKKVIWKSSNKKIAVVSKKGVVKAKKKGTVRIYAIYGTMKKSCKIVVKKKRK